MTRQFATMREALAGADEAGPQASREASVDAFRRGQVAGKIVMLDRVCPYDPPGAVTMVLVASEAGGLVRAPLGDPEIAALLGFADGEGSPAARVAAEVLRLRARVAALESRLRARARSPLGETLLGLLARAEVVTRREAAETLYPGVAGAGEGQALRNVARAVRRTVRARGGRLETICGVGWRLDAETRARLAREGAA
jgi:hypothetical protein